MPADRIARLALAAALAVPALTLPACAGHHPAAAAGRAHDTASAAASLAATASAEARDADRAMSAASAARDPEAFIGHVAADALFLAGRVSAGRAAVGLDWSPQLTPGGPLLTWEPDRAEAAGSGDLAVTGGTWRWLPAGETDPARAAATGRYFTVWRRDPDGLLRAALDGSDLPLPALPAAVTRRPIRTLASADGSLVAEAGLLVDGEREVGWYAVARQGAGAATKDLVDAGRYGPGL